MKSTHPSLLTIHLLSLLFAATVASAQVGGPSAPAAPGAGAPGTATQAPAPGTTQFPVLPVQTPTISNQPAAPAPGAPGAREVMDALERSKAAEKQRAAEAERQPGPQQYDVARNEFQELVAQSLGYGLPLFGYNLFSGVPSTFAPVDRIPVTPDYVIGPGDEILIRAWGQIDVDYRATVDRSGAINIPRVGVVNVAGIRYQDLNGYLRTQIGRIFRNFELNVTMGELRSIQIFVVGQARRPGTYTVSSLSTLVNALFASGGPSARGSMRAIELKRGNRTVTTFDLYDLLLKGDKSKDVPLLPGDVIYIPPAGQVVAIAGAVNTPAIYELKGETTLGALIGLAGGFTTTAATQKAMVERIVDRRARVVDEFTLDKAGLARALRDGDVVQLFALSPRFENAVTLRGSVANPGRFPWREGMRIRDILPEREALIVPDYWLRQNQASRVSVAGQARLRVEVRRTYDEINWDYAVIERLNYEDLTVSLVPFNLGKAILENDPSGNVPLRAGDVVTIFSKADLQVPISKQTKFVRLEGEFATPGVYQILPGETLRQLVARIGGLTGNAYLFGAEFTREGTREFQQRRLDEAIEFLEREFQRNQVSLASGGVEQGETEFLRLRAEGQRQFLARLRQARASGRIVLELPLQQAQMKDLPDVVLEDGDRLLVPARPSTVSVVGSVYNQNAFLHRSDQRISDYLARAGGPTRGADTGSIYVVRADGAVISRRQSGGLFGLGGFEGERLMPGDTIVVPEDFQKFRWTKELKDWTQIFYQFALGVAGLKVLRDL